MNRRQGFLLIECCVYLVICAILTVTIMRWIAQSVLQAGQTMHVVDRGITSAVVLDVLMRDIQGAPSNRTAWVLESDHMVWRINDMTAIGWYKDHTHLVRKEGTYDAALKRWEKHHTSTVAYNVNTFTCAAQIKDNRVQGIYSTFGVESAEPVTRYIPIRNGRC